MSLAGSVLSLATPTRAQTFCRDADDDRQDIVERRGLPLGEINPRVVWGAAIESPGLYDTKLIDALVSEAPKCLAIASGVKFGNLFPTPTFVPMPSQWRECDDIVSLAGRLDTLVRADCLAWNDWLPDWLVALARDRPRDWRETLQHHYRAHFAAVFDRLARRGGEPRAATLRWCGVVNEPFNPWAAQDGRPAWRSGAWLDAFGLETDGVPGYIHQAFALGEKLRGAPGISLFLNETNCDNDRYGPMVRPALLDLVDKLQRAGRSVDAVGLECHLMPQWMSDPASPDWGPFVTFLRALAKRGVEIYLTELDVNDCSVRSLHERDERVARYTHSFVAAALTVPAVTMVTNWDFSDRYSWLRGDGSSSAVYPQLGRWADCVFDPPCPRPTIYDEAMNAKSARRELADALASRP